MRTDPMSSSVALAVGRALREQYSGSLGEAVPTPLMDLLIRLSQRSSPVPEVAHGAKGLSAPLSTVAAKYDRAIEEAARWMMTVAGADQFATAAQAWILEATRLRGGLPDGSGLDRAALRRVLDDVVELAVARSIHEISSNAGRGSGTAPLADGLRQSLRRTADRFLVAY